MISLGYCRYNLKFMFPAGTSRGVLREKPTYFLKIWDDECSGCCGFGEIPYFPGLSVETEKEVIQSLGAVQKALRTDSGIPSVCSSVAFGVQQAYTDFIKGGDSPLWPSSFTEGKEEIKINGLVWMGNYDTMLSRLQNKLKEGFSCIKIKIGAVEWDDEIALLRFIRDRYGMDITIRVDANGAFSPSDCMRKLEQLAEFSVHSIEQPIKARQWTAMADICRNSPVPVALDEELIGLAGKEMEEMTDIIRPAYIVLKPALCGGFENTERWIRLASERGIGWWVTSALESSVGLNAIAQFVGRLGVGDMVQGLGTGMLYSNNLPSPLNLKGENLKYTGPDDIYRSRLESMAYTTL